MAEDLAPIVGELQRASASPETGDLGAVASISHELRAPLHAIVALSELLVDTDLNQDQRELASAIHREGQALQIIVDDLLDLSKINAGKLRLVIEPMSPRAVVDEAITMFSPAATEKGLQLSVEFADNLPIAIRSDRHRLRQVLVNLISNAVKYTSVGGVDVRVAATDGHRLQIIVADTGPGIPDRALADLFTPFQQARAKDSIKGTGLGLSITHQLITLMDGEIYLATSEEGTTFTAAIPYEPARRSEDAARALRAGASARVLVVDDTEVNRLIALSQLERLGHDGIAATNGDDALAFLETEPFDLVLMDWHMPGMDGLETVAAYHQRADTTGSSPIPIIMMTADVSANARKMCAEAGTADFLPKPVSLADLDGCIRRFLPDQSEHDGPLRDESHAHASNLTGSSETKRSAIDRTVIDTMVEDLGGSEPIRAVIATFITDAQERRAALRPETIADRATAARAAHTLKSTAALLGAHDLSHLCGGLEHDLRNGSDPTVDALTAMSAALDVALEELSKIRVELAPN